MRCEGCDAEAPALKTVRWRTGERTFVLCDPCWGPMRDALWIVPGLVTVHGVCRGCPGRFCLEELADVTPGGRRGAPSGLCTTCFGGCL